MFIQWIVMSKNSFKNLGLLRSHSSLYLHMSRALILDQIFSYFGNFSSSVLLIPHNSFHYEKIMSESPGKCVDTSRTWSVRIIK